MTEKGLFLNVNVSLAPWLKRLMAGGIVGTAVAYAALRILPSKWCIVVSEGKQ